MIVGGITGTWSNPRGLILGRHTGDGRLRVVGRTGPVPAAARAELAAVVRPPDGDHPWPPELPGGWAGGLPGADPIRYLRVRPDIVAEVSVDVAKDDKAWRHLARFIRIRIDLSPDDVPTDLTLG
jgi:hypothetical protein